MGPRGFSLVLAVSMVAALLLLAACAPGEPPKAAPPPPQQQAAAAPTAAAAPAAAAPAAAKPAAAPAPPAGPKKGGVLRTALESDLNFQPTMTDRPSAYAREFVLEGLTRVDDKLQAVPNLAKSWEVATDGLTWTFKLKENVKWHDGKPFTAEDVKFSMENMLDAKNAWRYRANFDALARTEVVDPLTVRFVTKEPFAALPAMLSYYAFISPKHILEKDFMKNDTFNLQQPVGTGPFKVAEVRRGQYVRLVANREHHRGGPNLDEIVIKVVPDPDTTVAQLMSGEIDLHDIAPGRHLVALQTNPNIRIESELTTNFNHALVDYRDAKFKDVKVRLALTYALDRQKMLDAVMMGHGKLPTTPLSPSIAWAYNNNLKPLPYDPEKAKQLLKDAGYAMGKQFWEKDGQPLGFTIHADNVDVTRRETAVIAQQYWRAIGIDAKLEILDWNVWLAERWRNVTGVVNGYWSTPTDPNHVAYWGTGGSQNNSKFSNPEVDRLYAAAAKELDPKKRAELYYKLQEVFMEDPPTILFYYYNEVLAMNKRLKGFPNLQWRDAIPWADEWYLE